jgi:hypothetical protein
MRLSENYSKFPTNPQNQFFSAVLVFVLNTPVSRGTFQALGIFNKTRKYSIK